MKTSDVVAIIAFASFGAWWLIVPRSVNRFYSWLHKRYRPKKPLEIRIVGLLWIILVIGLGIWQIHNRSVRLPSSN